MIKKQKEVYTSPTTETLVVRFEGMVCTSDPAKAYHSGGAGSYGVEDTNDNGDY